MRKKAIGLITATVCGACAALPTPAAAVVRDCGNYDPSSGWTQGEVQGAGIFDVTARDTRCRVARRVALNAFDTNRTGRQSWRYGIWRCRYRRTGYESTATRCEASGRRVVRWTSGA